MLLVTGPVSRHMQNALKRTYDATPEKENTQLTARLTELAGRLIFPVPPLRS